MSPEKRRDFWLELVVKAGSSQTIPRVPFNEICPALGISDSELADIVEYLQRLEAISSLTPSEVKSISRGVAVPGKLVALVNATEWHFFRVNRPQDLQTRLAAELSLMPPPPPTLDKWMSEAKTTAINTVRRIGLTTQQLEEAEACVLDGQLILNMPIDFYFPAWKRAEIAGNTVGMRVIAASLARLHKEPLAALARSHNEALASQLRLREALDFVEQCCAGESRRFEGGRTRGSIPEDVRHEVWRRDQGRCVRCGGQEKLEFDHIIPWSKGGSDTARNLQLLCEVCNRAKSDDI